MYTLKQFKRAKYTFSADEQCKCQISFKYVEGFELWPGNAPDPLLKRLLGHNYTGYRYMQCLR